MSCSTIGTLKILINNGANGVLLTSEACVRETKLNC